MIEQSIIHHRTIERAMRLVHRREEVLVSLPCAISIICSTSTLTSHPQLPPPQQLANNFFEPFAMAMIKIMNKCTESNQETINKLMKDHREQRAEERAIRAEDKRDKEKGARRLLEDADPVNAAPFSA
ncbi:unnamed protein product [Caenorhabditis nigoni]